jgi:hypothetical protein|tara:strand:- start:2112 stop:2966 length:855 start_codon:yes stop_codon:yes gene_type:complete
MAKILRTSGDYTVKSGDGYNSGAGDHTITLDAKLVRIPGNFTVNGTQTVVDSQTLTVEDQFIEVNRNNSTAGTEDSGLFFNQGSNNDQIFYYDADQSEFVLGSTNQNSSANIITNITPGNLRIGEPTQSDHASTKNYVDTEVAGASGSFSISVTGDDSTVVPIATGNILDIAGGSNISTVAVEPDTVTISLNQTLTNIESISSATSNANLTLASNGTGDVVINDTLTFSGAASTPTASAVTKIYNKTAGGGGTGLYFINSNISSGTEGELISKKKATALAIALG